MITIPETDLVVHELCLGTNVFGWSADTRHPRRPRNTRIRNASKADRW